MDESDIQLNNNPGKVVTKKEGMPPGSDLHLNKQSPFITSDLFFKWLQEIFVLRKSDGFVILILDGHSSHCSNCEMLKYAEGNKDYYKKEADRFILSNPSESICQNFAGKLIGAAWNKASTSTNGIA
ncbi:hypothetical protein ABEB36_014565 [Hypothenemus hampei]|uniref:DDE-1 domain-containing protein n=1 Tax=Hypothenemus hampei TaxID=57062 RepID=A0ABD1E259_HYPHA